MVIQKEKKEDSVVKINSELLLDVEEFINSKKNKFKYVNKKQFIDLAVSEYFKYIKKRERGKK